MQKLRADLSKRMEADNSNMTAYRDYDSTRRANDIRRLQRAISHFDDAVTQGMVAMKEIASAFEAVGQSFTELTLGSSSVYAPSAEVNPMPTEADMQQLETFDEDAGQPHPHSTTTPGRAQADGGNPNQSRRSGDYAASVATTRLTDETNSQVRRLARLFAEEARRMNEGAPFQAFNTGMHRDVVTRLRPVSEHLKSVNESNRSQDEALGRYNRYKAEVEKIERQYAKRGKPFCNSKSHKKYSDKRDEAWKEYLKKREKFNGTYAMLMEVNDHAAAQTIHRYLVLNNEYLRQMVESINRILPAMEEVYPLNSEYNSIQNQLIVEAVAAARPVEKHRKKSQEGSGAEDEEGEEGLAPGQSPLPPEALSHSSIPSNSMTDSAEHLAPHAEDASHSRLEEPAEDDARPAEQPADQVVEAADPPHEPEGDAVQQADNTKEDRGHVLTQPTRLQKSSSSSGGSAAVAGTLPGSAVPEAKANVSAGVADSAVRAAHVDPTS